MNTKKEPMERITAYASGRVQGVGFRSFVTDCAAEAGVCGYVRNLSDGSVLIIAEGSREDLRAFATRVRAAGDPFIRVEDLRITISESTGEFSGFGVRW
jgi:acylphosphatase